MNVTIVIIDYGMGNIWSVRNSLKYLGFKTIVSSSPKEIEKADILILPGVGSFRKAMQALSKRKIDLAIKEAVMGKSRKLMGICLGMQLLGEGSTEDGKTDGLGLIPAWVDRFDPIKTDGLKIPHIGFNNVFSEQDSVLFKGITSPSNFYFVHSFHMLPDGLKGKHGICRHGQDILAAYEHENIFATQFHPEKSQTNGLKLLKNFLIY
jgi:imidazole glycerol-phosphate synthase subunit HisH